MNTTSIAPPPTPTAIRTHPASCLRKADVFL